MIDFGNNRILVVGDLMLDRYWHGDTGRISPEAPVPVVRVGQAEDRAGGAGNVALNIRALGGEVRVLGLLGADAEGERLMELLRAAGCEPCAVTSAGWSTVTKLRVISRHQQLIRLDFEQPLRDDAVDRLTDAFIAELADADLVVLSDYAKGALPSPQAFIRAARAAAKPVIVDPKRPDLAAYRGATVLTPNLSELEAAVGPCASEQDIEDKARNLMRDADIEAMLITRSEQGMTLVQRDGPCSHLAAQAREVFDVTGAGDTVVAALAMGLASGHDLERAAVLSNLAAGIVVGKLGTAVATVDELRLALETSHLRTHGIIDEPALMTQIGRARAAGERIVMTNGCFDILHPGHVAYLEQAARLGDRLIVAVNDDASVTRLKGEGRPVNPVAQRMAVLAGLRAVDWVVPFSEDTPERLICAVRPDVLVKGGDYRPQDIAGGGCVCEAGGEVVVLDYLAGFSTTAIIRALSQGAAD